MFLRLFLVDPCVGHTSSKQAQHTCCESYPVVVHHRTCQPMFLCEDMPAYYEHTLHGQKVLLLNLLHSVEQQHVQTLHSPVEL